MGQWLADLVRQIAEGIGVLRERLPVVLDDPRAYPRETLATAIAGTILLVIVVVFLLLGMDAGTRLWARHVRGGRPAMPLHSLLTRFAAAFVVAGTLALAVSLLPTIPAVCEGCDVCHELERPVAGWRADAHRSISCYECHARPGILGSAQAGIEGASHAFGARESSSTPAHVFERRCIACHRDIAEGVTATDVRMRHSDTIRIGYPCLGCHPYVGHLHEDRVLPPITRSRMTLCFECHNSTVARSDCTLCHDGPPRSSAGTTTTAGATLEVGCDGCHTAATTAKCVGCHGSGYPLEAAPEASP